MSKKLTDEERRKHSNTWKSNYEHRSIKRVCLKLNKTYDTDLIDFVESLGSGSINQTLKDVLREGLKHYKVS